MELRGLLAGGSFFAALAALSCIHAASADPVRQQRIPPECEASVSLADDSVKNVHFAGVVKSITAKKDYPGSFVVKVAVRSGTGEPLAQSFDLYIPRALLPFKTGDRIEVGLRRGGGWHRVYDSLIKDAAGRILLVTSGSGADDWADGWKVTTGKVVESEQNPNTQQKSERRTHALDFARGTTQLTIQPSQCVVALDGKDRYLVSGSGHSWLGMRPPEGVDYQSFSMIRW